MSIKPTKKPQLKPACEQQPTAHQARPATTEASQAFASFESAIEYRLVRELKANSRNARSHSQKQIQQIAASVREFGFLAPILVDETGVILAGHGRAEAAKLLGLAQVPTVPIHHLTAERKRAFMLADNRLAQLSSWDEDILSTELQELSALDLDFEFEVTGFDTPDVDRLDHPPAHQVVEEPVQEPDRKVPAVSALGDLWILGDHRLLCGSALVSGCYERLMDGERAQMVFADPPYNVAIDGHVCGLGSVKHAEFQMASGEMSENEFTDFLTGIMRLMAEHSADGAIHFLCMDWRHMGEVLSAGKSIYGRPKNLVVWNKTNAGMGTFYRSKHELVFVFKVGTAAHINNFGLGERGRYRSNVWDYAGVNTFKRNRMAELAAHPTVKPLPLVMDAIKDCSKRRGVVLDPFLGSGTTLLAAEKTGRIGRGMELDPHYADVAIHRWQSATGKQAIHLASGLSFEELARERSQPATA
jgi:DNA modification methylase